jgi:hypothetical protein
MRLIKWFLAWLPYPLPKGMTEFNGWVEDIAQLSGLPYNDRLKNVIAQFILMLPPDTAFYSKRRLSNQIRKAAANQVAGEVLQLEQEKKKAENPGETCSTVGRQACPDGICGHRGPANGTA